MYHYQGPKNVGCQSKTYMALLTDGHQSAAKDREWFENDYITIDSFVKDRYKEAAGGFQYPVIGIGTVMLPVRLLSPSGEPRHGKLRLTHVLHAPSLPTNYLGGRPLGMLDFMSSADGLPHSARLASRDDRNYAALFHQFRPKQKWIYRLWISEPPAGPRLGPARVAPPPDIRLEWTPAEFEKWKAKLPVYPNPHFNGPYAALEPESAAES